MSKGTTIKKWDSHKYVDGVCCGCGKFFETTVDGFGFKVVTKTKMALVTVDEKLVKEKVEIPSEIEVKELNQTFTVIRVEEDAFKNVSATEIVVPATIEEVGKNAFGEVNLLTFECTNPPKGLEEAIIKGATVNVPEGCKESYLAVLKGIANVAEVHIHVKDDGTKVAPTCEKDGSVTYRCTKCGEIISVETLKATGHKWDNGTVTKEPTESSTGIRTYHCTNPNCTMTKTEDIPKKQALPNNNNVPFKPGDIVISDNKAFKVKVLDINKKEVAFTAATKSKAKTVTIPAKVVLNGVSYKVTKINDNAFKGNKYLTKVTIPSSVIAIGKNAFKKCTALKKITIPSKVTTIGKSAFDGCKKMKTITIKSTKLTSKSVSGGAFKGLSKKVTIKVPKKKLKEYKKLLKKKGFKGKVKA